MKMTSKKKILCLPGDYIGPEVMESALVVFEKAASEVGFEYELDFEDFGGAAIDRFGHPLSEEVQEKSLASDAVLLGAVGGPGWDECEVRPEQGLLALRAHMRLYANLRPLKVEDSLIHLSPLKEEVVRGTDLIVVRELGGGAYFGKPRTLTPEFALDGMTYKRFEIERIVRYAFDTALKRRRRVVSVDKANVLATSKLWREVAEEVASDYPEVSLEHRYVDAMAMELVTRPSYFDVIVTENLFGDILSDETSVLGGSLGILPSASFGEGGTALYEPAGGSAPDIAGKDLANPAAMVYSTALMARYSFNREDLASVIEEAVKKTMDEGVLTRDLNARSYVGTSEWTRRCMENIERKRA